MINKRLFIILLALVVSNAQLNALTDKQKLAVSLGVSGGAIAAALVTLTAFIVKTKLANKALTDQWAKQGEADQAYDFIAKNNTGKNAINETALKKLFTQDDLIAFGKEVSPVVDQYNNGLINRDGLVSKIKDIYKEKFSNIDGGKWPSDVIANDTLEALGVKLDVNRTPAQKLEAIEDFLESDARVPDAQMTATLDSIAQANPKEPFVKIGNDVVINAQTREVVQGIAADKLASIPDLNALNKRQIANREAILEDLDLEKNPASLQSAIDSILKADPNALYMEVGGDIYNIKTFEKIPTANVDKTKTAHNLSDAVEAQAEAQKAQVELQKTNAAKAALKDPAIKLANDSQIDKVVDLLKNDKNWDALVEAHNEGTELPDALIKMENIADILSEQGITSIGAHDVQGLLNSDALRALAKPVVVAPKAKPSAQSEAWLKELGIQVEGAGNLEGVRSIIVYDKGYTEYQLSPDGYPIAKNVGIDRNYALKELDSGDVLSPQQATKLINDKVVKNLNELGLTSTETASIPKNIQYIESADGKTIYRLDSTSKPVAKLSPKEAVAEGFKEGQNSIKDLAPIKAKALQVQQQMQEKLAEPFLKELGLTAEQAKKFLEGKDYVVDKIDEATGEGDVYRLNEDGLPVEKVSYKAAGGRSFMQGEGTNITSVKAEIRQARLAELQGQVSGETPVVVNKSAAEIPGGAQVGPISEPTQSGTGSSGEPGYEPGEEEEPVEPVIG